MTTSRHFVIGAILIAAALLALIAMQWSGAALLEGPLENGTVHTTVHHTDIIGPLQFTTTTFSWTIDVRWPVVPIALAMVMGLGLMIIGMVRRKLLKENPDGQKRAPGNTE